MADRMMRGGAALAALGAILVITALWWALALWPLPTEVPAWLARARLVCFGSPPDGLPDTAGWLVLAGQPLGMLLVLVAAWGRELRAGLAALGSTRRGRLALAVGCAMVLGLLHLAGSRIARAGERFEAGSFTEVGELARIDRPAPRLELVDQSGESISLHEFRGRRVLVTFAFAHCQTICPTVVRAVLEAQAAESADPPAVLVVTLDPWRDPPARLPAIAAGWRMGPGAHVLSGPVEVVEATMDAWGVTRERDTLTGEVRHPTVVLAVDAGGRLMFSVPGSAPAIRRALAELRHAGRVAALPAAVAGY